MRRLGQILVVLVAIVVALALFGPREPVTLGALREVSVGADPDAWLAAREAQVPGIRPELTKRIFWASPDKARTRLAIVYVHGFSASLEEIRPVPDRVAAALGANLFYTRLTGHGALDGAAMAAATPDAWLDDVAEAMAVGRAIGEKVILIGASTGGTLAALAVFDPPMSRDLAGLVLISPNFEVRATGAFVLTWPFARTIAPLIAGREQVREVAEPAIAAAWTTRYPTEATVPMAAVVKAANDLPFAEARLPALFMFCDADQVVNEARTAEIAAEWGGRVSVVKVSPGAGVDPSCHVIAGDLRSPAETGPASDAIIAWAKTLQP
jgi:pimeloyl-ACP methyl ester carboxylesterase